MKRENLNRKVFLTSDTHFQHSNILKYCGRNQFLSEIDRKEFERRGNSWHDGDWKGPGSSPWRISRESVEAMDDALINNINNMVGEDDILYHLGDFCFAPKGQYYNTAKHYRNRIKCKEIYFLWGNHDKDEIGNLFTKTFDLLNTNINGQRITLCHYALATWDKSHRGAISCYGHSHSNLEDWMDKVMPGRRSMDVGVDNAFKLLGEYRPFSFEEIIKIMDKRNGFSADHHGMRTGPTEEQLLG